MFVAYALYRRRLSLSYYSKCYEGRADGYSALPPRKKYFLNHTSCASRCEVEEGGDWPRAVKSQDAFAGCRDRISGVDALTFDAPSEERSLIKPPRCTPCTGYVPSICPRYPVFQYRQRDRLPWCVIRAAAGAIFFIGRTTRSA